MCLSFQTQLELKTKGMFKQGKCHYLKYTVSASVLFNTKRELLIIRQTVSAIIVINTDFF